MKFESIYRLIMIYFSLHNIIHHFVWCHLFCFIKPITSQLDLTLYSAVYKDLRVKTSCIIFLIIAKCVALKRFTVHLECSMSLYQIMHVVNNKRYISRNSYNMGHEGA